MIALAGGDVVLADRVLTSGSVIIDPQSGFITAVESVVVDVGAGRMAIDCRGHTIVPGFVDVHMHGVEGIDVLDGAGAVATIAARLPKYGVTAFCPTSVACPPAALHTMLEEVASLRAGRRPAAALVLPAHLESNFINPDWRGAQPLACLRSCPGAPPADRRLKADVFSGADIMAVINSRRADIGIVTVAPELAGGLDLVRALVAAGPIVSIGHSGATYEQSRAAIDAGVRHATHLFNRMSPMTHRAPGVAGAALESRRLVAEVICDGCHVHPAVVAMTVRMKGTERVMAITDGTAGSGQPVGSRAHLGGQTIVVTANTAELEDGTLAGSVATMDRAFRMLVRQVGLSLPQASQLCSTTPAIQMGLPGRGRIAAGAIADLAVLDTEQLRVRQTFVAGNPALEPPSTGLRLSGLRP